MTTALESIFNRLAQLPSREQEAYAEIIKAELDGDKRWDELFAATTDDQWARMRAEAEADSEANGTISHEDFRAGL